MPQQPWMRENSFLQGVDAGNRLFESIADVQHKQLATEAARAELPLRLIQLQTANEEAQQQLKIQRDEAPLRLQNLKLAGQQHEVSIQGQQMSNELQSAKLKDMSVLQVAQANLQMGDTTDPVLNTPEAINTWNQIKSHSLLGQSIANDSADFKSRLSKLDATQRAAVMNIPLTEQGMPSPIAWNQIGTYEKQNEQKAAAESLDAYTKKRAVDEKARLDLQELSNKGRLDAAMVKRYQSGLDGITNQSILAAVKGKIHAIYVDPTKTTEQKEALIDEVIAKAKSSPNTFTTPSEDSDGVTDVEMAATFKSKRIQLRQDLLDAKLEGDKSKIKKISDKLKILDDEERSFTPNKGGASNSSGGVINYNANTRTLDGYNATASEGAPTQQSSKFTGYRPVKSEHVEPKFFEPEQPKTQQPNEVDRALSSNKKFMDAAREVVPTAQNPKVIIPTESFLDYMNRVEKESSGKTNAVKKDIILEGVRKILDQRYK